MLASPSLVLPVRGADDARAAVDSARAAGVGLTLLADGALGVLWLGALLDGLRRAHPDLSVAGVLDCGDRAGEALGALTAQGPGVAAVAVLFTGTPALADRLADIAAGAGRRLLTSPTLAPLSSTEQG
ncbi:hypothetical protein [Azospirillum griseum]|uniref:Uncharacterized protein n=1 Tax=Azospirillum griseum TaxID=2496639 RepID=A0A431VN50_9PROT|nr:hypothetical protein [Azospirillum griseum]RTR23787.1 hypothetical protein EJ903_04545 [Azospirillum griseum]